MAMCVDTGRPTLHFTICCKYIIAAAIESMHIHANAVFDRASYSLPALEQSFSHASGNSTAQGNLALLIVTMLVASFLLVAMPGAPSSVLAPSSDARSP